MSFARDKLSLHLRCRIPVLMKRVKATELMANLPCLTQSDREEIQAMKDRIGNSGAVQTLLDYVQKRMNWPEELMSALEVLEHQDLAEDLRAEWTKHNHTNPSPAAPPTRPSLPISESSDDPTSSMVLPAWPAPPPESLNDQHTEPPQSPPSQHFSPATAPASPPVHTSMDEDNRELSKPDVLLNENQPYSGGSWLLQMDSGSVSDPEPAPVMSPAPVTNPVPEPLSSLPGPLTTATPQPYQEYGVSEELEESVSRNEPEEDTYPEVLVNVIHVSEDAYIQNQEGQTQSMLGNNDAGVSETLPPSYWKRGPSPLIFFCNEILRR
uniref:Mitochondrial antiviral-signaling protein n=1 Tax=Hucho hucho TaxID=62062 RepID=A0A4W5P3A3_9TELE